MIAQNNTFRIAGSHRKAAAIACLTVGLTSSQILTAVPNTIYLEEHFAKKLDLL